MMTSHHLHLCLFPIAIFQASEIILWLPVGLLLFVVIYLVALLHLETSGVLDCLLVITSSTPPSHCDHTLSHPGTSEPLQAPTA